jgi:hypothetical protein
VAIFAAAAAALMFVIQILIVLTQTALQLTLVPIQAPAVQHALILLVPLPVLPILNAMTAIV